MPSCQTLRLHIAVVNVPVLTRVQHARHVQGASIVVKMEALAAHASPKKLNPPKRLNSKKIQQQLIALNQKGDI